MFWVRIVVVILLMTLISGIAGATTYQEFLVGVFALILLLMVAYKL